MYKYVLLVVFLLRHILSAQVPFMNLSQLPLLQNPSFAGGKDQKRLVLAGHTTRTSDFSNKALYLAYDDFVSSKGLGIGFHYLAHSFSYKIPYPNLPLFQDFFDDSQLNSKYGQSWQSHQFGVCVAPKYNLGRANALNEYPYTFSPAVELGYTTSRSVLLGAFRENYTMFVHSDSTSIHKDSIFYADSRAYTHKLYANAGMRLSSRNFIFAYLFSYTFESVKEQYKIMQGSIYQGGRSSQSFQFNHPYHRYLHRLSVTYSFSQKANSDYNLLLYAGMDLSHYSGLKATYDVQRQFESEVLKHNRSLPWVSGVYATATLRIKRALVGASYLRYRNSILYGFNFGLQNTRGRILCALFPEAGFSSLRTMEAALSLYF